MAKNLIVGFGEALVDVLPTGEVVGGAPLNFAIRAAELSPLVGCKAALVTRIGADERGEKVLSRLNESSLDTSCVQVDAGLQTGYVDVELNQGQPSYTIGQNVAWDAISFDELLADLAYQTATVCFGTLVQREQTSREALQSFLSASSTACKILDINFRLPLPSVDVIEDSLKSANILKCNEDELRLLSQQMRLSAADVPLDIAGELQQKFDLRCVFWTRGAEGCRWQDGDAVIDGAVPKLPAAPDADSVGAGDAASAALAIGVTAGWSPQKIVNAANLCGAFAASQRGPTSSLSDNVLGRLRNL